MSLGSGVIPAWLLLPKRPMCMVCAHSWGSHRADVGCVGPFDASEDSSSFYSGTCNKECKEYIKDNLDYLRWKHDQKRGK